MPDKPKASPSFGLELNSKEIKGAFIVYQNRKAVLKELISIAVDREQSTDLHVKPLYIGGEEKQLRDLAHKSLVVTGIQTKDVLVRPLTIQLTKEADIESVIEFQAEPLLPYATDEAIVDRITLEKDKDHTKLIILAAKIEQVSKHLELWHSINIEPEVISCAPMALAAFSEVFHPTESPHIHINIGLNETACIIVSNGKLLAAQGIRSGVDEWMKALEQDAKITGSDASEVLKGIKFTHVSDPNYPYLYPQLNNFRMEITRVVYALRKYASGKNLADILFTGEGAVYKEALQFFCSNLHMNFADPTPTTEFDKSIEELQKYAVPIGLALTVLPHAKEQINFRQKALAYPNPWKRIKKPMAAYLSLCFLLALCLGLFGNAYIANKEDTLKQQYVDLLALMKKPYAEFEKEIRSKGPLDEQVKSSQDIPVISLTQTELQNRLALLEKEIKATPDMFPLYPNVPRVSDVLAWLSTHPHIAGTDKGADGKPDAPRIVLESFSYKMVKKPEQSKKREPYQAKVEIEFSTPTPRFAREFHDILLAPNDIVDPKGDVKWNAERGKYRASFFLKDKTIYPSIR
jgi:type IV pilus assembly protein PilM